MKMGKWLTKFSVINFKIYKKNEYLNPMNPMVSSKINLQPQRMPHTMDEEEVGGPSLRDIVSIPG